MQLTRFTDLGLRVLMYLCDAPAGQPITIAEVSERFEVAHNHLTKVVQFMGQQGWLVNVRGKSGGMRLARPAGDYRLGELVRLLERSHELISCTEPPCTLHGRCALKGLLNRGEQAFYATLDQFTLVDAVAGPTGAAIVTLHRGAPRAR
jgi:Rrf2 family nitric oxide-sensitive transcriptional repressor